MWSVYKIEGESPERDYMRNKWPQSSAFESGGGMYLFVETHSTPVDAVDATKLTTEQLIALINTHTGPNAVHVTKSQASTVHAILAPVEEAE